MELGIFRQKSQTLHHSRFICSFGWFVIIFDTFSFSSEANSSLKLQECQDDALASKSKYCRYIFGNESKAADEEDAVAVQVDLRFP